MPGAVPGGVVPTLTRARARLVETAREVRRFARGILGSDAYDVYLAHHRRTRCGGEPLTEKQFWRAKYAAQDVSPEGRCC